MEDSGCVKIRIDEVALEEAVLEAIRTQIWLFVSNGRGTVGKTDNDILKEIKGHQRMLGRYKSLQAAAFEDFAEGRISRQEYLSRKKETADCREEVNRRIAELNNRLAELRSRQAAQESDTGEYACVRELTREMLVELVKMIRADGENAIEIVWNFKEKV